MEVNIWRKVAQLYERMIRVFCFDLSFFSVYLFVCPTDCLCIYVFCLESGLCFASSDHYTAFQVKSFLKHIDDSHIVIQKRNYFCDMQTEKINKTGIHVYHINQQVPLHASSISTSPVCSRNTKFTPYNQQHRWAGNQNYLYCTWLWFPADIGIAICTVWTPFKNSHQYWGQLQMDARKHDVKSWDYDAKSHKCDAKVRY